MLRDSHSDEEEDEERDGSEEDIRRNRCGVVRIQHRVISEHN